MVIWNCDGLLSKFEDPDIVDYLSSFSFICLCETFLEYFDHTIHFPDFDCYVSPARKLSEHGRRSGGVICLIAKAHKEFFSNVPIDIDNVLVMKARKELLGLENDVLMFCTYIPPQGSRYYIEKDVSNGVFALEECIFEILQIHSECDIMICGDLNARTGLMNTGDSTQLFEIRNDIIDESRCSEDRKTNDFGLSLLCLLTAFDLSILNGCIKGDKSGKFTFISNTGNSVVDYCIVSQNLLPCCDSLEVRDCILSPHMYLNLTMRSRQQVNPMGISETLVTEKIVWDINMVELYLNNLTEELAHSNLLQDINHPEYNVDFLVERLTACVVQSADFMSKTYRNRKHAMQKKPWFDGECFNIRKKVRILLRRYRNNMSQNNKNEYIQNRKMYKELLRQKKSNYNRVMSVSLSSNIQNPEAFWSQVRKICRCYKQVPNISLQDWYDHFTKVMCDSNHRLPDGWELEIDQRYNKIATEDDDLNAPFDSSEVQLALSSLRAKKSSGIDNVCSEMLICSIELILPYLAAVFNEIFSTGAYPKCWSESIIVPIHKKGNVHETNNYRGISLTSILSKVFVHVLKSRLTKWADENNLLSEMQAGFRKGYSTIDNVFVLYNVIQRQLQKRKKLYVAYVDFRKAFDTVNRDALWKILERNGVGGHMINILKSMYSSVRCRVRCTEGLTDPIECILGLKQGCKASSILFLYLIDEIAKEMEKFGKHGVQLMPDSTIVYMLMFADDIALLSDTVPGLQNQLNVLQRVSDCLGLVVNAEKTKVVIYRMGGHVAKHEKWFLGNERLEIVNSYRYLGMMLSTKLSSTSAHTELVHRAKAGMIQIVKSLRRICSVNPLVFFKLFDTRIQPMLLYSSEVWGLNDCQTIENVHITGMKMFCNVSTKTPNIMLYGDCGRYPLSIGASVRVAKYWCKLLKMEQNRYPAKVYKMMLNDIENGNNWAFKLREFLIKYNFENVWLAQEVQNEHGFIKELKKALVDNYSENWMSQLHMSDRYILYRQIKQQLALEKYLMFLDKKIFRDVFIKFRMGVSELYIHKYRFSRDHPSFTCPSCREEEEDDKHFLLECPAYEDLRSRYIRYAITPAPFKDVSVLTSEDIETVRSVSKYLFHAFKRRKYAITLIQQENGEIE